MKLSNIFQIATIISLFSHSLSAHAELKIPSYHNPVGEELPIIAGCAFETPDLVTADNFEILRDCGFNVMESKFEDDEAIETAIEASMNSGVKILLSTPGVENYKTIRRTIDKYKDNDVIIGYVLTDEPPARRFGVYRKSRDIALEASPGQIPFITLLPNYASLDYLGTETYREYLRQFMTTLELPVLCYDHYPVIEENGQTYVRPEYFENLEDAMAVAEEFNVPLWTYILSSAHFSYPVPTLGHMMFQAFCGLAYGSQGLKYYTYGVPPAFHNIAYRETPIDGEGNKSHVWDLVQELNYTLLNLSHVFLGSRIISVHHTGTDIPYGTKKLRIYDLPTPIQLLRTERTGVVASHFMNNGREYYLLVNKDIEYPQTITIKTTQDVLRIYPDGSERRESKSRIRLEPGGFVLLTWLSSGGK